MRFSQILPVAVASLMLSFSSCGPSAEEKAAKEKATQDSIDAAMATEMEKEAEAASQVHDSLATAGSDSTAAAPAENHEGDKH